MSDEKSRLGIGNVEITLGGQDYVLRPTLNAAQQLSRLNGGIRGTIDAVARMDFDVVVRVITLGLGPQSGRPGLLKDKDIPELVWSSGLTDDSGALLARCIEYLHVLANGGRPINKSEENSSEDPQS